MLDNIRLSAQQNLYLEGPSLNILVRSLRVVCLITYFRCEIAFYVLRLSHFSVATVVGVVLEQSLFKGDVSPHHLTIIVRIDKTIDDFLGYLLFTGLRVEESLLHGEMEGASSQLIVNVILATFTLAHLKRDEETVYLLVRTVSFNFVVIVALKTIERV